MTMQERFWDRVAVSDGCWEWAGARDSGGYGQIGLANGKRGKAHRVAWEIYSGLPVPARLMVCHHCDNPSCVRPDHLFIGTHLDNMRDAKAKGRLVPPPIPWGRDRTRSHCKYGHDLSVYGKVRPNGWGRTCMICKRIRDLYRWSYRAAHKERT